MFSSPLKQILCSSAAPSPSPLPPGRSWPPSYSSLFCLYGFAYSGHFIHMKSHDMFSFVSGFFPLPVCFQVHSCCSLCLCFCPCCGCIAFHCLDRPPPPVESLINSVFPLFHLFDGVLSTFLLIPDT